MRKIKVRDKEKWPAFPRVAAFCLILLFFPSITGASSITLEYRLGFNGLFTLNRWAPVTVIIENKGKTINGHLEIIATSGSEYRRDVYNRTYSTPVELPTHSKKQYHLTIFIETFIHPLVICLKEGNEIVSTRSINLRSHYRTQELLLFIDSQPGQLDPDPDNHIIPVLSRGRFLPEVWYGYDGVRMLVVPSKAWQDINEKQLSALEEWISRGGHLVAAGGINYGSLSDKRLSKLLPLSISGIREVGSLSSLDSITGVKLSDRDPVLLLDAALDSAQVKVREQNIPVISQKSFGRGSVFFLAFDFEVAPFREWGGRQRLWAHLLSAAGEKPAPFFNPPDEAIYNLMLNNMALDFPSFPWVILLITLYVGPALFIIKKIEIRREQRWVLMGLMMLWVIITSSAFYGFYFTKYSRHSLSYNQFSMIRLSGPEPVPLFKEFIGIYNLKNRRTQVRLGNNPYPVKGFMFERAQDKIGHFFNLEERLLNQVVHIDLDRWSHRFFSLEGRVHFPIKARAVENEKGLVLRIENLSPYNIDLCRLYYAKRFFDIQPLPAEMSVTRRIDHQMVTKEKPFHLNEKRYFDNDALPRKTKSLFNRIPNILKNDLLLSIHSRNKERSDMVHLTGWIAGAVKPVTLESSGSRNEAVTLVEWEIPVER